mgnify:CR=1 FL=1
MKHKLSYHRRLFLLLLVFSWTLVGCFILFQYGREKHFKAERLDAQLQLFNLRMLDALADGATPEEFIAARDEPFGDLRVTVIDAAGMRGARVGGAQMSEKHSNFMLNTGGATAADLETLGEEVRKKVLQTQGISLEWEIMRVGRR